MQEQHSLRYVPRETYHSALKTCVEIHIVKNLHNLLTVSIQTMILLEHKPLKMSLAASLAKQITLKLKRDVKILNTHRQSNNQHVGI